MLGEGWMTQARDGGNATRAMNQLLVDGIIGLCCAWIKTPPCDTQVKFSESLFIPETPLGNFEVYKSKCSWLQTSQRNDWERFKVSN